MTQTLDPRLRGDDTNPGGRKGYVLNDYSASRWKIVSLLLELGTQLLHKREPEIVFWMGKKHPE